MRELTAAILDAVDLDAPVDPLTLTVSRPPEHGTLIHGIYGLQMSRYKDMGQELLRRSLPAHNFTLRQLREGQAPRALSDPCNLTLQWGSYANRLYCVQ